MADPNKIIHQPVRLKICAALSQLNRNEYLDFPQLKKMLKVTDGNLGSHLATLEEVGYIELAKEFKDKKPSTSAKLTANGRKAFNEHLNFLRAIVEEGS